MSAVSFVLRDMKDNESVLQLWNDIVDAMKEAVGVLLTSVMHHSLFHFEVVCFENIRFQFTLDMEKFRYPVIGMALSKTTTTTHEFMMSAVISILTPSFPKLFVLPPTCFVVFSSDVSFDVLDLFLTAEYPRCGKDDDAIPLWVRHDLARVSEKNAEFVCFSLNTLWEKVRAVGLLRDADRYYLRKRHECHCDDNFPTTSLNDYLV
jgi:hypothetical protein